MERHDSLPSGRVAAMAGFTLLEMLVVLAILAIGYGIAGPAILTFIQNSRITAQTNAVVASLNYARAEAIDRGVSVTVCKSNDNNTCDNSVNWEDGWIIFVDSDGNGSRDTSVGSTETLLRTHGPLEPYDEPNTLRGNNNVTNRVTFNSRGSTGNNGTLALCDKRAPGDSSGMRGIVVANTGRVQSGSTASCNL
jgi:type IV fimbrial biogenesis protein FimT